MPQLLPLFPLQLVALPGAAIPLHIFEERYKTMVGQAEANGAEFGLVQARDNGIVNAGCTVVVETVVERYPDGRFDMIARGKRRFTLISLDHQEACLRGEVEYFDDDDWEPVSADLRDKAMRAWREVQAAAQPVDEGTGQQIDSQHPLLSFQLAQSVNDLEFQDLTLRTRSEAARLRQFVEFAETYIPRTLYVAKMKRIAPTNGSGHKPAML